MRNDKRFKETTNSREYRIIINDIIGKCPFCGPHRGCNRNRHYNDNWKQYRKTQWRD